MKKVVLLVTLLSFIGFPNLEARKIRNSLSIAKESKSNRKKSEEITGKRINLSDSISREDEDLKKLINLKFAGYDKEVNSSKESFIIVNPTQYIIKGFEVRIDYLDKQGRMLHSRDVKEGCLIPPGETRRFDIKSWDTQHTYYYHLGNEPKKVATPFQVSFTPLVLWIEE